MSTPREQSDEPRPSDVDVASPKHPSIPHLPQFLSCSTSGGSFMWSARKLDDNTSLSCIWNRGSRLRETPKGSVLRKAHRERFWELNPGMVLELITRLPMDFNSRFWSAEKVLNFPPSARGTVTALRGIFLSWCNSSSTLYTRGTLIDLWWFFPFVLQFLDELLSIN